MASTLPRSAQGAEQIFVPSADGTLVDGICPDGGICPFDGVADAAEWTFNPEFGHYAGAITLVRTPPQGFERRVVWEYNLGTVTAPPPVTAKLTFKLRGAGLFPAEPAEVDVYAYPADLLESLSDFSAGPATLVITKSIAPYQPATTYVANVSDVVNAAIVSGLKKVAFRFQINQDTIVESNQAFMDVLDSDPSTKPFLTVRNQVPSDYDNDRDIDLVDFSHLAGCALGPGAGIGTGCAFFDADFDSDVDLLDMRTFLNDDSMYAP
ncbi:MAG: hypothetical protein AAB341_05400 [Planctomycetota bacterium]